MKIKEMNTGLQFTFQPDIQETNVQIKVLQKQKANLQERLTEIKENKEMDPKRKIKQSQLIKKQIEEIDQQIQNVKIRQLKDRINVNNDDHKEKKADQKEDRPYDETVHQMSSLIAASQTFEQVRTLDKAKTTLTGRLKTLQAQGQSSGEDSSYKQQEIEELNKRIQSVDQSMMKKLSEAYKKIKEGNHGDVRKTIDPEEKKESNSKNQRVSDHLDPLSYKGEKSESSPFPINTDM